MITSMMIAAYLSGQRECDVKVQVGRDLVAVTDVRYDRNTDAFVVEITHVPEDFM